MAERDEQRQMAEVDAPASGLSQTGRAVGLARLLHHECVRLLQLYKDKETFLAGHAPDAERIVSLSPESDGPDAEQRVQVLHAALRQCLGLLHCVIQKEEEEWGELEGDYETMRTTVRVRLEHLLYSTKDLAETEDTTLEVTPDHQCVEVQYPN